MFSPAKEFQETFRPVFLVDSLSLPEIEKEIEQGRI